MSTVQFCPRPPYYLSVTAHVETCKSRRLDSELNCRTVQLLGSSLSLGLRPAQKTRVLNRSRRFSLSPATISFRAMKEFRLRCVPCEISLQNRTDAQLLSSSMSLSLRPAQKTRVQNRSRRFSLSPATTVFYLVHNAGHFLQEDAGEEVAGRNSISCATAV